ncbi:hypothetical protein P7K49_040841 [Saguinus oedipus]|uniref:Fibronectin type-III domain-containing protein n=1 Tax=Saguinus oedipus TaxID=9490 RepID=A0ABQ9T978_SAGOE|nr:hypothetical protein P7K49_040841 [Saguinus oedipus]
MSFADIANTSLAITWKGPPDWTDYNDFELQWFPRDALTVFNPYNNRKSEGRIVYGLRPGRSYQFSVKTVSGDSWKTYSKPIFGSVRTSMTLTKHIPVSSQRHFGLDAITLKQRKVFMADCGLLVAQRCTCSPPLVPGFVVLLRRMPLSCYLGRMSFLPYSFY